MKSLHLFIMHNNNNCWKNWLQIKRLFHFYLIHGTLRLRENTRRRMFYQELNYYYPEPEGKIQSAISEKFTRQFIHIIQKGY
ncbi:hypothetical protein FC093_06665 [Ilyomonas limi]|uniref:Uncharacterized protein n=1 Tax=Ilyomonas limi TaxID=2575867 RepID=A0A4U3L7H4_9BACT|nr:hypothetical protein [Ilyomonas limi]TKK69766.1 hypothetical protein FC093_06665 [Ilyomonas limi]